MEGEGGGVPQSASPAPRQLQLRKPTPAGQTPPTRPPAHPPAGALVDVPGRQQREGALARPHGQEVRKVADLVEQVGVRQHDALRQGQTGRAGGGGGKPGRLVANVLWMREQAGRHADRGSSCPAAPPTPSHAAAGCLPWGCRWCQRCRPESPGQHPPAQEGRRPAHKAEHPRFWVGRQGWDAAGGAAAMWPRGAASRSTA